MKKKIEKDKMADTSKNNETAKLGIGAVFSSL